MHDYYYYFRNIATMSFTTVLEKACLAKDREFTFPSWVMGKLCTPESPILLKKWVPYLLAQLESAQTWEIKNEIIVALGITFYQIYILRVQWILGIFFLVISGFENGANMYLLGLSKWYHPKFVQILHNVWTKSG